MTMDMESLWAVVLGIGGGVAWFIQGFHELKTSRIIQNIPTSKIMTGAVGTNVEIKGQIISSPDNLLNAPISGQTCAFYSIEIQRLVKSKNHSYWKKIDQLFSSDEFYVEDGSGARAQVFIEGADIQRQGAVEKFQIRSDDFSSMPDPLYSILKLNEARLKRFKLKQSSWLFSQKYRFVEWSFRSQEPVYVLGFAESGIKPPKKNKLKFSNFMQAKQMIEKDPRLQTRFDHNQDGFLASEELERGAHIVGVGLQIEPVQVLEKTKTDPVKMIFKKRKGFVFFISNIKEKNLVKNLSLKAALKVWGGPIIAIASSVYLIFLLKTQ